MEQLERDIEKLKIERMQLEFHVERTGTVLNYCKFVKYILYKN